MFTSRTVRFPPTTTLVIPFATPLTFAPLDFVRVPASATNVEVEFDFGDGTTDSSAGAPNTLPAVTKTYNTPGRYTLRIQVRADTTLWQRYQWPVQVACSADDFAPSTETFDFLAAVHASLELPGGRRQLIVPLPAASSIGYGSYPHGGGGDTAFDGRLQRRRRSARARISAVVRARIRARPRAQGIDGPRRVYSPQQ